jgi:dihydroxy-acid dehydratase
MLAILGELIEAGHIHCDALTVNGKTIGENYAQARSLDTNLIRPCKNPVSDRAGFAVVTGNLFDSALVKTSVISKEFKQRFLSRPDEPDCFVSRVIVFDGPEDYRRRIEDPALQIDETCMLVVRGAGPVGYPGSAEVVNMSPPGHLINKGIGVLPCMGDGRQSGTSATPSILNVSPESAVGGNLGILQTGDRVRVDLHNRRVDVLISDEEIERRRREMKPVPLTNDSPWQEFYRQHVGQLETGACLEFAVKYHDLRKVVPRHSH